MSRLRVTRRVAVVFMALACVTALLAVPAGAADTENGIVNYDPREVDVDPGEQFEVDVLLQATTHSSEDGVWRFNYTVGYNSSVLSASDVEIGPWMAQGEETDVITDTEIDEENGTVFVHQERDPPAGGVTDTGETATATVTFEVAEDAPPSHAIIGTEAAHAQLSEYPLPILTTREVNVTIDGGGEQVFGGDEMDDGPGVTLADADGDDDTDNEEDDALAIPGPTVPVAAIAALLGGLLYKRRRP